MRAATTTERRAPSILAWNVWLAALVVVAIAAFVRSGIGCRPITYDEADYAYAASKGFVVNWLDHQNVNTTRHFHGPLLAYLIAVATSVGGYVESWIRVPGVLASSLAAGAAVLATADFASGSTSRRALVGLCAGLLLATAPASVVMSSLARPQPLVELLIVLNAWLVFRYLRRPDGGAAGALGASLGLQFAVMEYGFVIAGVCAVAVVVVDLVAVDRRTRSVAGRLRDAGIAFAAAVATWLVLWPAGLRRRQSFHNLMYYVRYADRGQVVPFRGTLTPHVPWWAYGYWYWVDHPLVLVFVLAAIALVALWMWRARTTAGLVAGVFAGVLLVAVHRAHIMSVGYSCFAVPSVVMAGVLAGDWAWRALARRPRAERAAARAAMTAIVVAAIVGGTTWPARDATCPRESAIERVSRELASRAAPGDVVLASQSPIVRWVVELEHGRRDLVIEPFDPSNQRGSDDDLRDLRAGRFAWAVMGARPMRRFPDAPLFRIVSTQWERVAEEDGAVLFRNPAARP